MKPYQSRTSTMNLPVTPLFLRTPTSIFIISNMGLMVLIICLLSVLLAPTAGQYTTVAIVALNDIHGSALPTLMEREDTKQNYTYGGLQYMAGLINQIQDQYPGHTLILDSGDQFQGGIESSPLISHGKIMNDFYDAVGLQAQAIGNHEFDFGPDFLLPYYKSKESQVLAANLRSEKGQSEFLPKQKLSQMYELKSGIKIGVIGLITIFTPITTSAFKNHLFPDYKFLDYKDIVINESKKLRKAGANAVLVVGHLGNDCNISNAYGKWTKDSKQPDCGVPNDEATKLINDLPEGTIDGLLQGHRHKFAHHFIKGIPYLGTINGGYYFNVLYLKFFKTKLIDKTIEGPIPVCDKVFANTGTCEYLPKDKLKDAGELVEYRFHNKPVKPNLKVKAIYEQEWVPKMADFLKVLVESEVDLVTQSNQECELANLVTTLMMEAVPSADFVIINPGGLRTEWYPGYIQEQHFYNMFPFENYLESFDIMGSELLKMLEIVQNGPLGFYHTAGLKITVSANGGNNHRFINATLINEEPIIPDRQYRGMSIDFLLQGGDDFKEVMGKVYTLRNPKTEGSIKDLIRPKLIDLQVIREGSLIDPAHPRLVVIAS